MEILIQRIVNFLLDLFDAILEVFTPPKIKKWYSRRKKLTKTFLRGAVDGLFFIAAFCIALAIGCGIVLFINLIGIPYDGG